VNGNNRMQLRPYQHRAIEDLRNAYRSGARAPLLVAPTGAGKTVILAAITASATARGRKVLILVHRRELIHQASSKLAAAGVKHGIIAAGIQPSQQTVQVASVQTLVRRLATIKWEPCLIIIDEAHHAVAGSWSKILDHWPGALRLGVTATPCRLDGRGLGDTFDALVKGPSVQMLTSAGYLSPVRIFAPPVIADLAGLRIRAGDYANNLAAAAMNQTIVTGDAISHYQRHAGAQQAIAFCCSVDHAASVRDAFWNAGIGSALLLGDTADRDKIVAAFASGTIRVLVTVDVVSEGFDIPAAGCAILLRPTASLGLYLQQVGRVLRPAPGKETAIILDHVGNVIEHGFPDDIRQWSLKHGARPATGEPQAPAVRTCPQCFAAFKPQPRCPVCGAECEPPKREAIEEVGGELVELKRNYAKQAILVSFGPHRPSALGYEIVSVCEDGNFEIRFGKNGIPFKILKERVTFLPKMEPCDAKHEQSLAKTLPDLLALAKKRGYSPGWAYKIHQARGQRRNHHSAGDPLSARLSL
jgi:superfamily II DNA or RNA helicase